MLGTLAFVALIASEAFVASAAPFDARAVQRTFRTTRRVLAMRLRETFVTFADALVVARSVSVTVGFAFGRGGCCLDNRFDLAQDTFKSFVAFADAVRARTVRAAIRARLRRAHTSLVALVADAFGYELSALLAMHALSVFVAISGAVLVLAAFAAESNDALAFEARLVARSVVGAAVRALSIRTGLALVGRLALAFRGIVSVLADAVSVAAVKTGLDRALRAGPSVRTETASVRTFAVLSTVMGTGRLGH